MRTEVVERLRKELENLERDMNLLNELSTADLLYLSLKEQKMILALRDIRNILKILIEGLEQKDGGEAKLLRGKVII
ncbi:hypothetical protein [Candidatus Methanodesulfokora washburnensis]|uniref:DUF86 domain-containing protein n=1 Tax=Candidatus Methanodesulfokora washburnensis TaxID=2478471 RepID=A0A429GX23_9CREN|nr:hypothetical protein [Candidatus Methanodesulfokores washburnensis]RSN78299.1 hypothetical protein D6D85_01430 [Candidatus Methanodesulfokores washburnensis]